MPTIGHTVMHPFNNSEPLLVVRLPDGALGVVDEERSRVWVEQELV